MSTVHADFVLSHLFSKKSVCIRALVDTGATDVFVTSEVAKALGFDPEEVSQQSVTLADGRRLSIPQLGPLEIRFGDRRCWSGAFVLGDECLIGVIPLEAMDLVVDPKGRRVVTNPAHPDGPCFRV